MSTASDAFASPIEFNGITYPLLTVVEYGTLESAARNRARTNLEALANDLKLDVANRIALLSPFDRSLPRISQTFEYLETADGAKKALLLSLKKSGKSDAESKEEIEKIPLYDMLDLALRVSTLDRLMGKSAPADGADGDLQKK